jgi:tetratricopeptide (TPR) repeat protein
MNFDKVKAMRNAERFLAQGKTRAAINEYKRVVENDPKDFSTLNMLGDMYAKATENSEAVKCFTQVAEHYAKQGFAQKAIAIYNKISRLTPESLEVSAKLAQLYQMKGSVAEARSHYNNLAEQYTRSGRKAEALVVWNQIAKLDPNNTDICLKIADAYWQEEQKDEALSAYIEAGKRLSAKQNYDSSVTVFSRALEIQPNDLTAVRGFIEAQIKLGYTDEAAKKLEELLDDQPYNREIVYLLVDCYIDMNNPAAAETALIKLVEHEPSSYHKCLDIVLAYLKIDDLAAATRNLNIASEHLLVGGQAEELEKWINEILAKNPEHVDALRLLVRFYSWQREETKLKLTLERLAEAAKINNAGEDERYALSQLIMISPQNIDFAQRLHELNGLLGHNDDYYEPTNENRESGNEVPTFESYAKLTEEYENDSVGEISLAAYEEFAGELIYVNNEHPTSFDETEVSNSEKNEPPNEVQSGTVEDSKYRKLSEVEDYNLQKEIDSISFYIEQGYNDLAEKSLTELEIKFGKNESIDNLRTQLNVTDEVDNDKPKTAIIEEVAEVKPAPAVEIKPEIKPEKFDPMDEFRSEIGIEETASVDEGDYDTHYHLGIAYKEMGLTEDAIRELQDAIKFVSADDGTRRFLLCCNLLGHCFIEKQMPNLALMWFKRAMESTKLSQDEHQGLQYELANAYELGGDHEKALEYFEAIYANSVDYRDVSKRVKNLQK